MISRYGLSAISQMRAGDFVFWARSDNILASRNPGFKIADIWELQDGDSLVLTNRPADLPIWFDLHPREVSGLLSFWMIERLKQGYAPKEPIDAPNIWRVFAGDRVVWVGPKRDGLHYDNGVLAIVDFRENALVYGEPMYIAGDGWPNFGGFDGTLCLLKASDFARLVEAHLYVPECPAL